LGLISVTSFGLTCLSATRPMGSTGWPRLGRDLGPPEIILVEVSLYDTLTFALLLILVHRGRIRDGISLISHFLAGFSAISCVNIVSAVIAKRYLILLNCIGFLSCSAYLQMVLTSNGLFMLRFVQALPIAYLNTAVASFAFGDYLWGIVMGSSFLQFAALVPYLQWRRMIAVREADALVQADAARYHAIWTELAAAESERSAIDDLEREARTIDRGLKTGAELHQQFADPTELYAQATRLDDIFQAQVQKWAVDAGAKSLRAPLKGQKRMMQKVMRHYSGDPSRVCDLVRATLVFESFQSLLDGLKMIASDDAARVERIKNRFDSAYDATQSAGYRDVSIVMRIRTAESRAAGTDKHLCELQLQLAPILAVKSDEGHKKYVKWRNIRCA